MKKQEVYSAIDSKLQECVKQMYCPDCEEETTHVFARRYYVNQGWVTEWRCMCCLKLHGKSNGLCKPTEELKEG